MTNLQKLKRLYDEYSRGDFSRVDVFDPAVESESYGDFPEGVNPAHGVEELSQVMGNWLRFWRRPLFVDAEEYVESGNRIVVLIRWHGIGRDSGASIEARGAHLWTFCEGLAVRFDVYRDREAALTALRREGM